MTRVLNLAKIRQFCSKNGISFENFKKLIKIFKNLTKDFSKTNLAKMILFLLSLLGLSKIRDIIQGSRKYHKIFIKLIPWPPQQ